MDLAPQNWFWVAKIDIRKKKMGVGKYPETHHGSVFFPIPFVIGPCRSKTCQTAARPEHTSLIWTVHESNPEAGWAVEKKQQQPTNNIRQATNSNNDKNHLNHQLSCWYVWKKLCWIISTLGPDEVMKSNLCFPLKKRWTCLCMLFCSMWFFFVYVPNVNFNQICKHGQPKTKNNGEVKTRREEMDDWLCLKDNQCFSCTCGS